MSVLIIAEHQQGVCLNSVAQLVTAAGQLSSQIDILVVGAQSEPVATQAAQLAGVRCVLWTDESCYEHQLAENVAKLIVSLAGDYEYVLASATTMGKNLLPRVAALLDVAQLSEVIAIESSDTFVRPIYAGNALETVQSFDSKKIMTLRTAAFAAAQQGTTSCPLKRVTTVIEWPKTRFVNHQLTQSSRPDLATAKIVVAGGRGVQSKENFQLIEQLADALGAAVGASRAAVDAGFAPNDYQVGQTGKVVAPQLYIAVGISGAIQHVAGMKDSKVIVAINQDEDAPIFAYADYGLVGDLFEIIPQLIAAIGQ